MHAWTTGPSGTKGEVGLKGDPGAIGKYLGKMDSVYVWTNRR